MKLWDVKTRKCTGTLEGHGESDIESILFSPDGKTLVSRDVYHQIKLWNVATAERIATYHKCSDRFPRLIPLDVQYADIDHFRKQLDFTYDEVNFKGLPQYIDELKQNGVRFIIILVRRRG